MTDFNKSCCFTGHRTISPKKINELVKKLELEIEWMISHGVKDFYAGGALGFDSIAALKVLWFKFNHLDVRLHLILPCPDQTKFWNKRDIDIYNDILNKADTVTVLSDKYDNSIMFKRNRAMVDACKYCLCFYDSSNSGTKKGGTLYTVNYAKSLGRIVINLDDEPVESYPLEFSVIE